MPAPRRLLRRLVRLGLVSAIVAFVRDRALAQNRDTFGPHPLDRR